MKQARTFACLLTILLASLAAGCGKGDLSDPKATVKTMADAMHKGDAAGVKACTVNADPALIDGLTSVATSTTKLHDAAVAKFGKDGENVGEDRMGDMVKTVDDAEVKINGDTATLTPKNGGNPIALKKDGGSWKVDFSQLEGMKDMGSMAPMFKSMADANSAVADEIAAGKYATAKEAKKAVSQKIMTAVMGGMKMPESGK